MAGFSQRASIPHLAFSMHWLKRILALSLLFGVMQVCLGAEAPAAGDAAKTGVKAEPEKDHGSHSEGLPARAVRLRKGGFLSNSMFVTWIVAAGLIIFARRAMKNAQPVPGGAQNFWEWMVESLYTFLEDIVGADLVKKTFWFFATIFIFILFANWEIGRASCRERV